MKFSFIKNPESDFFNKESKSKKTKYMCPKDTDAPAWCLD